MKIETLRSKHALHTHYRKLETNIPRNETMRPRSQFPHSCICERFIYSHDRSTYFAVRILFAVQPPRCRGWGWPMIWQRFSCLMQGMRRGMIMTSHVFYRGPCESALISGKENRGVLSMLMPICMEGCSLCSVVHSMLSGDRSELGRRHSLLREKIFCTCM